MDNNASEMRNSVLGIGRHSQISPTGRGGQEFQRKACVPTNQKLGHLIQPTHQIPIILATVINGEPLRNV